MEAEMAAGPKTGNAALVGYTGRMQQAIEDQIVALTGGLAECLESARTTSTEGDPDGHRRSNERTDAVKFTAATAGLLQALGKLKGGFRQDYHVMRQDDRPAPKFNSKGWQGNEADLLTPVQYDLLDEKAQVDYERWTNGLAPKFDGWRRPIPFVEALRDEPSDATPLLPENRGSNKDAAKP